MYQLAFEANKVIATLDLNFAFILAWQQLAELLAEDYVGKSAKLIG